MIIIIIILKISIAPAAHLAHHVYKSGRKTSINQSIAPISTKIIELSGAPITGVRQKQT